jgi:hypothetical protein
MDENTDPGVGERAGQESSLSNWVGPYATEMLGRGAALADMPYQAYFGPLTAGESGLQSQAFQGIAGLAMPEDMGAFTPGSFTDQGVMDQYINPYIQGVLDPQLEEIRRQSDISRVNQAGKMTRAGAFGGSRQQLADSELTRAMLDKMTMATGQAYADAFERGRDQFNIEQRAGLEAQDFINRYGMDVLATQLDAGDIQRGIEQEGIMADRLQFEEERDYPFKMVQYMQSLLQGLPLEAQSYSYNQPSDFSQLSGNTADILALLFGMFPGIFDGGSGENSDGSGGSGGGQADGQP